MVRTDKIKLLSGLFSGDLGAWQSLRQLTSELSSKEEQETIDWLKEHMGELTYDELIDLLDFTRPTSGKTEEDFNTFYSSLQSKYNL